MKKIEDIVRDLHEINFGKDGIIRPENGGADYDFTSFLSNGKHQYKNSDGCACRICDSVCKDNLTRSKKENNRFTYVAHGTHTLDFIEAHRRVKSGAEVNTQEPIDTTGWSTKPVMFVFENPSNSSGNNYYVEDNSNEQKRFPSEDWYWLDSLYKEDVKKFIYPKYFVMGEYGKLIFSIIQIFILQTDT